MDPIPATAVARRRADRSAFWLAIAALVPCLGYLLAERYVVSRLGFPLDDSWIHLQFARNLAAGQGLSYNPGELVTGSTAPLWTALLSLAFFLPGNPVGWPIVWAKIAGIACHLAGVDATRRLARTLGLGRGLAALAAGLVLTTSVLVWSALSGMEISLFVWLSLEGMILHLRERRDPNRLPLALPVLALAALARPEGLLLLALAGCDRLVVVRREGAAGEPGEGRLALGRPPLATLLLGAGLALLVLVGPILVYRWAGGSVLPTTFAVKTGGRHFGLPTVRVLFEIFAILFRPQPIAVLLAGGGVLALLERLGTRRDQGLLLPLWVLGLPLAYAAMSRSVDTMIVGNFGRYYFPLLPPLLVLTALALERAWSAVRPPIALAIGGGGGGLRLPLRPLLVLLLFAPAVWFLAQQSTRFAQNIANVEDSDVAIARWLAPRLHPEALLAVNDIGAIKYLLPNRVLDMAGIASPDFRREVTAALAAGKTRDEALFPAVERRRPDYLVIFPNWFLPLSSDPRFRLVYHFVIPDNITMGGQDIGVYATPWTRYPLREEPSPALRPALR